MSIISVPTDLIANTLRCRPTDEDDWTALRRSFDPVIAVLHENRARTVALTYLACETPVLRARRAEQERCWGRALTKALAERDGLAQPSPLAASVLTGAALSCLNSALNQWGEGAGCWDLDDLVDEAFVVMASV
ncbi:hypothetical protein [Streptomyces sp. NPDC005498]|uniref:acyl-CoA-like ligand-binding transcription factor n=1 Tax=Streptomyces sp. NPDC005498 TaxID=3364717 RepID=UPI0036C087EE